MRFLILMITLGFIAFSCTEDTTKSAININNSNPPKTQPSKTSPVVPVDITKEGFDLLDKIQGHWVGNNKVMADKFPWFAFDFRAISASHVHAIFEGGTMGDLYTLFFISDFKNTRTIMARNGGILNGIYRASYFVLDSVKTENNASYYRFVDAVGGKETMFMQLRFTSDSLYFDAFTSRLGANRPSSRHMTFKGNKRNPELAQKAAAVHNFPQNAIEWDFSSGFKNENLWINIGDSIPRSATFLEYVKDPFKIEDHGYISYLQVNFPRTAAIKDARLFLYLSKEPLTDTQGFMLIDPFENDLLKFPVLEGKEESFTFDYLHPGDYYVTIIADINNDNNPSAGDITNISQRVTVQPNSAQTITISNISIQN